MKKKQILTQFPSELYVYEEVDCGESYYIAEKEMDTLLNNEDTRIIGVYKLSDIKRVNATVAIEDVGLPGVK